MRREFRFATEFVRDQARERPHIQLQLSNAFSHEKEGILEMDGAVFLARLDRPLQSVQVWEESPVKYRPHQTVQSGPV